MKNTVEGEAGDLATNESSSAQFNDLICVGSSGVIRCATIRRKLMYVQHHADVIYNLKSSLPNHHKAYHGGLAIYLQAVASGKEDPAAFAAAATVWNGGLLNYSLRGDGRSVHKEHLPAMF